MHVPAFKEWPTNFKLLFQALLSYAPAQRLSKPQSPVASWYLSGTLNCTIIKYCMHMHMYSQCIAVLGSDHAHVREIDMTISYTR